jgi:hypothetical protein
MKRRSTGMMVGGIVMVSVAPILFVAALANSSTCAVYTDDVYYGGSCGNETATIAMTVIGVGLIGGGIPLIIIGAKRVPDDGTASLSPWVNRHGGGMSLSLSL